MRLHFSVDRNTQFALGPTATTEGVPDGTWQYRQTIEFYRETASKVKPEQKRLVPYCPGSKVEKLEIGKLPDFPNWILRQSVHEGLFAVFDLHPDQKGL